MIRYACIGLDNAKELAQRIDGHFTLYDVPPRMYADRGLLYAESPRIMGLWLPVDAVIWYSYFPDNEKSFQARRAIALSVAVSFPDVRQTILHDDRALSLIQAQAADSGPTLPRGYAPSGVDLTFEGNTVLKVGDDHCGDGKSRVSADCPALDHPAIAEPFIEGESVRVLVVGRTAWVLKYESTDWRKNVNAKVTEVHSAEFEGLVPRARTIAIRLNLPVLGVDFIGSNETGWYLLEVNAYPGLDQAEGAQEAFDDLAVSYLM